MAKVHKLSPENYILTKARTLPVYKCLVTPGWQDMGMANVIVIRRHINGNCTAGLYLVDLMCLGIKDTFYIFNEPEEAVEERFNIGEMFFEETDYITAHNIVYAGHDFAAEFDIHPHKNFAITKFILDEDDERIPVIDVAVGDEEGKPHLFVNSSYNYGPALQKLKKNAGEGNYQFTLSDNEDFDDEFSEEKPFDDFDENDYDDESSTHDFHTLKDEDKDALTEALEDEISLMTEEAIIRSELLWRKLKEEKPLAVLTEEKLAQTPEMLSFEANKKAWETESDLNQELYETVFEEIREIQNDSVGDIKLNKFLELLNKYKENDGACLMLFHSIPAYIILSEFSTIRNALKDFPPSVQLALAAWNAFAPNKSKKLSAISKQGTVQEAFPGKPLHALHIKCFWLLKAVDALFENDSKNIIYYHSLIRFTGVGGHVKYLYAILLNVWLCNLLDIPENDILFQENG